MSTSESNDIVNAMSVDVEDYFQVSAFEARIDRADWGSWPVRVERNTYRVLDMLDAQGVKGTFFTLGWVARNYPGLVRDLVARGHELASHGMEHTRVSQQSPDEFRADAGDAKKLLEDTGAVSVRGYRAASYSINEKNWWALGVLEELGYAYSSSVYPVHHDLYGMPDAPRFPFLVGTLKEIPVTTLALVGRNLPCGGGGYFRLYPYAFTRWALRRINRTEQQPAVFYFHPWEIDPEQTRVPGIGLKTRFRHYLNLGRTEARLERLLGDFRWGRMDEVYGIV